MLDNLSLMTLHAFLIAVYFSFLWKQGRQERWRYFWKVFGALMVGAVALGWLMYFFPRS